MTRLTAAQVAAVEAALSRGERVELIPGKDETRVIRVRREAIRLSPGGKENKMPHP